MLKINDAEPQRGVDVYSADQHGLVVYNGQQGNEVCSMMFITSATLVQGEVHTGLKRSVPKTV